ncbi:hypothetical protein JL722_10914 [Aureococcus anophagefferens]|nr:hypothetical protein JL722_10914 [Aureococcus anophagefferens]
MHRLALLLAVARPCGALRVASRRAFGAAAAAAAFDPAAARGGEVDDALRSFNGGDYEASLRQWTALTRRPEDALCWSNRGTLELILGSKASTLGAAPTGAARDLLESSVASFSRSVALAASDDALAWNNLGNAQAVLLRWDAAARSYDRSLAAALANERALASIPASNRAQAALELSDAGDASRRTSTVDVVVGRWTPRTLDAYARFLASRDAKARFTVDLYKVTVPLSPLGKSMLKMVGAVMCTTGVYLGALAAGASAAEAFAAMYLFTAAVTVKFALTECDAVGVPKFGPLAWAGLSIALAAAALM